MDWKPNNTFDKIQMSHICHLHYRLKRLDLVRGVQLSVKLRLIAI